MADLENGFAELADELQRISERVTDEGVKRRTLEAGAEPIAQRAKSIVRRTMRTRTGNLVESIGHTFDHFIVEGQAIGWGPPIHTTHQATGFYGRFHEYGYRSRPGIRIVRNGRVTWKNSRKNPQGRTVQNPHIRQAVELEGDNAGNEIINTLRKELGG